MSGPCAGLLVIDLTRSLAGALTTMLLADSGADVVMIEPADGHPLRPESGFAVWARGKQSLCMDDVDAGELPAALARRADLVVEDLTAAEAASLGLDWTALRHANQSLVRCSIPSFGTSTDEDGLPPDDALVAARLGIMGAQPGFRHGPVFVRPAMSSYGTALLAIQALGAALYAREREDVGRDIQIPLWHGALAMQASHLLEVEHGDLFLMHRRSATDGRPLYRLYQCQDGRWLHLGVLTPRFWPGVALATGHPEWISDPRYATMPNLPTNSERDAFSQMLAGIIDQKPFPEWERLFEEYDVPCAPAQTVDEFLRDPQLAATEMLAEVEDPRFGRIRQIGLPLVFERTPGRIRGPAPLLGQDGDRLRSSLAAQVVRQRPAAKPPTGGAAPSSAFAGIRILDLSSFIAGPLGPVFLADLGADVIKVEAPEGDGLRANRGFLGWNRGKRGLSLDLKRPEAREILYRLVDTADVVLENMRPGVTERLGIDYETLRRRNPRLIYCSVTAFGPTGPYRHKPGFDPLLQARSGIERAQGGFQNPPVFLLVPITDNTCAMLNAAGIALALYERQCSGLGQRVETSLLRAACLLQSDSLVDYEGRPPRPGNDPEQFGPDALYRLYRCADGWIFLAARDLAARARLTGLTGIDCESVTIRPSTAIPSAEELALAAALGERFAGASVDAWLTRLRWAGVPAVRAIEEYAQRFADDELLMNAGIIVGYKHSEYGRVRQPAMLARCGPVPAVATRPAPLIGQHTREILTEAGYDADTISSFIERRIAVEHRTGLPI